VKSRFKVETALCVFVAYQAVPSLEPVPLQSLTGRVLRTTSCLNRPVSSESPLFNNQHKTEHQFQTGPRPWLLL